MRGHHSSASGCGEGCSSVPALPAALHTVDPLPKSGAHPAPKAVCSLCHPAAGLSLVPPLKAFSRSSAQMVTHLRVNLWQLFPKAVRALAHACCSALAAARGTKDVQRFPRADDKQALHSPDLPQTALIICPYTLLTLTSSASFRL